MPAGIAIAERERWFAQPQSLLEVGLERWSLFAGPTLHWAGEKWWATFTAIKQLRGGGEKYEGQVDTDLHLIEKTKNEVRLKVGYNF